jgi:hypothetical protein
MADTHDDEGMRGKQETLYDDEGRYDPKRGRSLLDDLLGWSPDFVFRIDAFPPHCLTISGAVSLAVSTVFLVSLVFNVLIPHYERVSHSVQTRCKILSVERDKYIDDALFHYKVKYPLPGIKGLRKGEAYCYGSQRCRCHLRHRSPHAIPSLANPPLPGSPSCFALAALIHTFTRAVFPPRPACLLRRAHLTRPSSAAARLRLARHTTVISTQRTMKVFRV